MKNVLLLLSVVFSSLFSTVSLAQTAKIVSKDDALAIAQKQFVGKDVDYYILSNSTSAVWNIFVDAEPMKGWQHDCYVLTIPKATTTDINTIRPRKVLRKMPPKEDYAPLLVKNRYGSNANSKPQVRKAASSNGSNEVAQRTYAIILSGGVNKNSNYERYWNDCSFIYQTLVNKYSIPKGNIYPIMSDGNNPAADMRSISGGYKSQPLDLDNDGVDEIKLAATKANVKNTLGTLANKLNKDDHLFIFVIDHGGTDDNNTNSYICLWNYESLYDFELATMLEPFTSKFVNVNVVLGQCFSGGFNDNLKKVGCVVASASTGSESSWACSDIPYDEFVYQWTCAVNEATHRKVSVKSDADNNGRVTMEEAFIYAKDKDRVSAEHPMYTSTPISVGEDLAFTHLAPAVDLYMKDNPEDTGKEPNLTTNEFWKSPSIWVRNQEDGIYGHQNPEYSSDHRVAFVNVRVYNRGKEDFDGEGKWILIYWVQASTGITQKAWKGRELYENKWPTGGVLEARPIDKKIMAGEYTDFSIDWKLPNMLKVYPEGNFHFCLLAKIMDTPYDEGYSPEKSYFDLKGSNDQVQKNVTIIRKKDIEKFFNVYVRNTSTLDKAYTLELIPQTEADATLYQRAKVEMSMSPKIYDAWERGGLKSQDIELVSPQSNAPNLRKVKFASPQSKIQNILLKGDEFDIVQLKFDFNKYTFDGATYTYDLVQKDEKGNVIGGETFVVESPVLTLKPIEGPVVTTKPFKDGLLQLKVNNSSDFNSLKWIDGKGETLGNKESINVSPRINGNDYTVVAMTNDGEIATQSISLENLYGIQSISTANDNIVVKLKEAAPDNASVEVKNITDGITQVSCQISAGANVVNFDGSNLSRGVYVVCYVVNSAVVDQQKVRIE